MRRSAACVDNLPMPTGRLREIDMTTTPPLDPVREK
jgi:hypothetical protein